MRIWVSSLAAVHDVFAEARPSNAVSLLSPGSDFPVLPVMAPEAHLRVELHDIRDDDPQLVAPNADHVSRLIDFLGGWRPDSPLLVHCWAGISRSTATAFIAACLHNPEADERAIAAELRAASPTAWPNSRMVAIADDLLNRSGRMADAVAIIGVGDLTEEARAFSIRARF